MAALEAATNRTYGNWRKPTSRGLLGLGDVGTAVLFAGVLAVIVTIAAAGVLRALVVAVVVAVVLGALLIKDRHSRSVLTRLSDRAGWVTTRAAEAHLYRSGPLSRIPGGRHHLPGLLAATAVAEHTDSYGRPFALIETPATRDVTVVIATEPDGASLVDADQVDSWVAHWGAWMAAAGDEPGLVAAAVTIEAAPDTGVRLRREVETHTDPDAHLIAQAMLREVIETYPQGSASIRAWVSLTFSAAAIAGGRRRPAAEVGRDLASRLPALTYSLEATGAGAAHPLSVQELCEVVRTAYDPDVAPVIEAATATGDRVALSWEEVGPTFAQASYDHYRHDSGCSTSWTMTAPPRGAVPATVLARLLAAHQAIDRKRVTLLYRPLDSGRAAAIVEADKAKADFRVRNMAKPSARAVLDQRSATLAAEDEARGAGLANFALVVTATVASPSRLPDARAAVNSLAASARLMLRPAYGVQDSTFTAGLPVGVVLARQLKIPTEIKDHL